MISMGSSDSGATKRRRKGRPATAESEVENSSTRFPPPELSIPLGHDALASDGLAEDALGPRLRDEQQVWVTARKHMPVKISTVATRCP
jgi:hypothetical protein